jgi:short subunit dehydrogenase-like uncharacterized protein
VARRIVLYGATGYVGRMVAQTLVAQKVRPVLAGRSLQNLHALGVRLGHGLDTVAADVGDADSLLALISAGDVVVSTVGPYATYGQPVVEACVIRKADYIDCAAEPGFLRPVFHGLGPFASNQGVTLIPGLGFEGLAGTVAASLALEASGQRADRLEVGYFLTGKRRQLLSSGARASLGGAALAPHFAWRDRQLVAAPAGDRVIGFSVDGRVLPGLSIGGLEHLIVPRTRPWIREVGVYVGGPRSDTAARVTGALVSGAAKVPGLPRLVRWTSALPSVNDGPGPDRLAQAGSAVVASTYDSGGRPLASVRLAGGDPYTFTQRMLAWAAVQLASGEPKPVPGALGPVEAFGLDRLLQACSSAGLTQVDEAVASSPRT